MATLKGQREILGRGWARKNAGLSKQGIIWKEAAALLPPQGWCWNSVWAGDPQPQVAGGKCGTLKKRVLDRFTYLVKDFKANNSRIKEEVKRDYRGLKQKVWSYSLRHPFPVGLMKKFWGWMVLMVG